jgi:WD40 repeat protein
MHKARLENDEVVDSIEYKNYPNVSYFFNSPDGSYIVFQSANNFAVVDWKSGKEILALDTARFMKFSQTGKYVYCSYDRAKRVIELSSGKTVYFHYPISSINWNGFSRDEKYLAYTCWDSLTIVDLATLEKKVFTNFKINGSDNYYGNLIFTSYPYYLVYPSDGNKVSILDINSGKVTNLINDFGVYISCIDLSYDKTKLAVSYTDGTVIMYSLPDDLLASVENKDEVTKEVKVYPNPAGDETGMKVSSLETGSFSLCIYTLQGSLVESRSWSRSESSDREKEFIVNLKSYSDGVYQVMLTSPSGRKAYPLYITK